MTENVGGSGVREIGGMGEVTAAEVSKSEIDMLSDDPLTLDEPEAKPKPKTPPVKDDVDVTDETTDDDIKETTDDETVNEEEVEVKDEEVEEKEEEVPESRLSFKEINAKYPTFFKDFPEVRAVIAREHQFSQVFPTVSDAKDSIQKSEAFDIVNDSLGRGEAAPFIEHFKKNPEGFDKFIGNFVKEIRTKSPNDYAKITLPAIRQILLSTLSAGRGRNDTNTQKAALIVAREIWGDEFKNVLGQKEDDLTPKKSEREIELEERIAQSQEQEAFRFDKGVYETGMRTLRNSLQNGFLKAEKSKQFEGRKLTDLQKKAISSQALKMVGETLKKDQAHNTQMRSLRLKAEKAGFAGDWMARVTDAYLARAKNLLPAFQYRLIEAELNGADNKKVVKQSLTPDKETKTITRKGSSTSNDVMLEKLKKGEITEEQYLAG